MARLLPSGQRRREDAQVAREGHLVPGTVAGNFWRELEPAPRLPGLVRRWTARRGEEETHSPHPGWSCPPEPRAFPVLALEAAQGHLRDGHPG